MDLNTCYCVCPCMLCVRSKDDLVELVLSINLDVGSQVSSFGQ